MAEIGRWKGHKFKVTSKLIRGFDGLQITGSNETEDKKKKKQLYVARKNGRPTEVTVTAYLNAYAGCDVRSEALKFVKQAQKGKKDYFYIGTKKLVTYKLLLTQATVKEVKIAPNNTWVSADVQLTFKQTGTGGKSVNSDKSSKGSSSGGGGAGGSGSGGTYSLPGSNKVSVKTSSPVTSSSLPAVKVGAAVGGTVFGKVGAAVGAAVGMGATALATAIKSANSSIRSTTSSAKTYSAEKKAKSSGGGGITRYAATK